MTHPVRVLVLGGGPDAEHDISVASSQAVAQALAQGGEFAVEYRVIEHADRPELALMPGDVIFPVLHGAWGEGGPLQELLEQDGRPYVGSGPRAARLAMDKLATKLIGAAQGARTAEAAIFDPHEPACPFDPPVVLKPVREGSSVGLYICKTPDEWREARDRVRVDALANPLAPFMVERYVSGRELTVPMLADEAGVLRALPIVEIIPASGVYDYDAKYQRDDTRYIVDPELPAGVSERVTQDAMRVANALGVRHIARVDFILNESGQALLLEVNTMPGFTGTSLVPKAAAMQGLDMQGVCARLVRVAAASRRTARA